MKYRLPISIILILLIFFMYYAADKSIPLSERRGLSDILSTEPVINSDYNFDTLYEFKKNFGYDMKANEKILTDGRGKFGKFIFKHNVNKIRFISVMTKYQGHGVFIVNYYEMHDYYLMKWIVSVAGTIAVLIYLFRLIYLKKLIIG